MGISLINPPDVIMVSDCRVSGPLFFAGETHFLGSPTLRKLFCFERVLLCAFTMNHALGPLFLLCCKFLFEMEFLKCPYLSKGFCTRKPILIRLPRSNLLQSCNRSASAALKYKKQTPLN